MTPYSRFRIISNFLAAALVAGAVCAVWPVASGMLAAATGGMTPAYWAAVGGTAAGLVLGWMTLTELVLPLVFHFGPLRRMILGRDFAEGTWLQAERGADGEERITVLHLRPAGFGFKLSGHTFGPDFQIDSNRMVEFSAFDGPMLRYVYRSLMPDGAGNQPHALSELAFDRIRSAPKSYLGFVQATGSPRKVRVEGVKLTKWSDRRRLRKADQRAAVLEQYWDVFFGARPDFAASMDTAPPPMVRRPVIVTNQPPVERRNEDAVLDTTVVVPRRRASDWRSEDLTPTADRIRARMIEDEDLVEDEEIDDEIEDAEDDVMLEDLYEDAEDDVEDEEDEIDADADEEECAQDEEEEIDSEAEYDAETGEEDAEDLEEEVDADAEDDLEDADEEDDDTPVLRRNRFAGR